MKRPPELEASHVSWSAGGTLIVHDVSHRVAPGTMVGLVGPNGAGKTSLLRCLAQLQHPDGGTVLIDGEDAALASRRETARRTGIVMQEATTDTNPVVWEVVMLGRTPHQGMFARETEDDRNHVRAALAAVRMSGFANRRWQTLSGGERQRVHLARALAQDTSLLMLDEPTNHLDIRHQVEIMALIRRLEVTAIAALHDLNIAALFCDELLVMKDGRVVAAGPTGDVLTADLVRDVYEVDTEVAIHPRTGRPVVVFLGGTAG